jgi:hypothetical protein
MYGNYVFNGNERPFQSKKKSTYWMVLGFYQNADKSEIAVEHELWTNIWATDV